MPSNDHYQIIGYEITGKPELADHDQHYAPDIEKLLLQTFFKVREPKPELLPELLKLVREYPHIPVFKNYLCTYYQQSDQLEEAYAVNRQLVEEHPDYLHGRVNLAAEYLVKEQYDQVPEILGDRLDLKALYPQREVFHVNELEAFMDVVCRYLIAVDRLEEAEDRIEILEEMELNPELTAELRLLILAGRVKKTSEQFKQIEDRRQSRPIGRTYDKSIQTDEPPQLHHPELQVLYQKGLRIDAEVLKELLTLPRETLVEDLKLILWDSVRRYEYFKQEIGQIGWNDDQHHFPLHALFLLTELRATEALPLLLDCLRQGDDYLELWYEDHRFETWWHFIYHLAGEKLEPLKAFMLESDIYYTAKDIVSEAVKQIGLHHTERRDEVLDWYEAIFHYFLEHQEEDLLIDPETISSMIGDLYDLRAQKLLPLIREFYDLDLVDTFRVGFYDDLEADMQIPPHDNYLTPVFDSIFQHHRQILTTWHGYMTEEERKARDPVWKKKRKGQEDWDYAPQHPPVTTSKRTLPKVGRNDPCPCGSGKKYKRCCWGK